MNQKKKIYGLFLVLMSGLITGTHLYSMESAFTEDTRGYLCSFLGLTAAHSINYNYREFEKEIQEGKRLHKIVLSSDGLTLALGSYMRCGFLFDCEDAPSDHEDVLLWDVKKRTLKGTLKGHANTVSSLAFSSDAKKLFSGSLDGTVRIWDVETGKELQNILYNQPVILVEVSADGTKLYIVGESGRISVWDFSKDTNVYSCEKQFEIGIGSRITCASLSPDKKRLIIGTSPFKGAWLVDIETSKCSVIPCFSSLCISAVTFSPDGGQIAVGALCGKLYLWNMVADNAIMISSTKESKLNSAPPSTYAIASIRYSRDGSTVLSGGGLTLRFFDVTTGRKLLKKRLCGLFAIEDICFCPQDAMLFIAACSTELYILTRGDCSATCVAHRQELLNEYFKRFLLMQYEPGKEDVQLTEKPN